MCAKRLVIDCSTGERRVEDFTFVPPPLVETQQARIGLTKAEALVKLGNTDWKILRHMEQRELVAAGIMAKTSMTEEDYQALLVKRQGIREKSNNIEATVLAAKDASEVESIPIEL